MARPPQEHNRRPTVVTSGPQAGKARAGSTVNRGVHYDDDKATRRPPAGSLADVYAETTDTDPFLQFLPEELHVLPEDPRALFGDLTVHVDCDGKDHTVNWREGGAVELPDHDVVADSVVAALGGDKPQCMVTAEELKMDRGMSITSPSWHSLNQARAGLFFENTSIEGKSRHDGLWEMMARSSRAAAVAHTARRVVDGWFQSLGGNPLEGARGFVYVNRKEGDPSEEEAVPSWMRREESNDAKTVAMFGLWGSEEHTRFLLNVNEDWYEDVRDNGYLIQGRLNLGKNEDGQVVADVDPETGEVFARVLQEGEQLSPLEDVLREANEKKTSFLSRAEKARGDRIVMGELYTWDYNDEFYFPLEGTQPFAIFDNVADAASWSKFRNIKETFFNPFNNPEEYFESDEDLPEQYQYSGGRYRFLDACVAEGKPLSKWSASFADYTFIAPFGEE